MSRPVTLSFRTRLATLLRARCPLIYITSWEEDRVVDVLTSVVQQKVFQTQAPSFFTWTVTQGFYDIEGPKFTSDTKDPSHALKAIERFPEPGIFVLKDFHPYWVDNQRPEAAELTRQLRDLAPHLKDAGKHVIFVSPTLAIPRELEKEIYVLDFELPRYEDIKALLLEMIAANQPGGRIAVDLQGEDIERLAKSALGLTLQEAENAFALAIAINGRLEAEDAQLVRAEKQQTLKKSGVLEFVDVPLQLDDVGGLDNLKSWLLKRNNTWLEAAQAYGLPAPKGVLLTGVPGCGKSLVAKTISALWQLPLLRFDIAKLFSPYVGTSEENMRMAILTAEALAPCVLWVDEIEKGFSGLQHQMDGGVSARVFGTFLTWMQEKSKPVFVVATSNNIEALPPELLRKGRFDEIFFVDLPTQAEREIIWQIHLEKRLKSPQAKGQFVLDLPVFQRLASLSAGFSGAEIEQVVISALMEAFSAQRGLTESDVTKALQQMVPLSVTQAEPIAQARQWAKRRAVSATLPEGLSTVLA